MTLEELLLPRYKVCEGGYPDCPFQGGEILILSRVDDKRQRYWKRRKGNFWYAPYFDRFPNIFKKLEWWESREENEIPNYLKSHTGFCKVISQDVERGFVLIEGMNCNKWLPLTMFQPATKEEYDQPVSLYLD
jgi:hypothetical protein